VTRKTPEIRLRIIEFSPISNSMLTNPFSRRRPGGEANSRREGVCDGTQAKSVLLIDDDPVVLMTIQHLLKNRRPDWCISTAADGHTGLAMIDEGVYDAVICDMSMAGLHGLAVLAQVMERHPHIIRIAVTAYVDEQWKAEHKTGVAQALILKPCTTAELLRAVERPQNLGAPGAARFGARDTGIAQSAAQKKQTNWDDDEVVTFN
jgi:CheY-like chemotaxis protein